MSDILRLLGIYSHWTHIHTLTNRKLHWAANPIDLFCLLEMYTQWTHTYTLHWVTYPFTFVQQPTVIHIHALDTLFAYSKDSTGH